MKRLVILPALLLTACGGGDPDVPEPGVINIELITPRPDDGAIMFVLSGEISSLVSPADTSLRVYQRRLGDSLTRVIVIGRFLSAGPIATASVDDVSDLTSYSAVIEAVADQSNQPRQSLDNYLIGFDERSTPGLRITRGTSRGVLEP